MRGFTLLALNEDDEAAQALTAGVSWRLTLCLHQRVFGGAALLPQRRCRGGGGQREAFVPLLNLLAVTLPLNRWTNLVFFFHFF